MKELLISVFLLVIVTCFADINAQSIHENYIYGYITDIKTEKRIPGVHVEVINEADTTERAEVTSDGTGRYVILLTDIGYQSIETDEVITEYHLGQNYPNPFNPGTRIPFQLSGTGHVSIEIFNILGQKINTLVNTRMTPGSYSVEWDGTNQNGAGVSAGVYFYCLRGKDFTDTRKMILLDGSSGMPYAIGDKIPTDLGYMNLNKPLALYVTIRCSSPFTPPMVEKNIMISPTTAGISSIINPPS